jgi:hypothetical protein
MSKTLYEQFKEDIVGILDDYTLKVYRVTDKEREKLIGRRLDLIRNIKQSYLNAIDCMIEHVSRTPATTWWANSEKIKKQVGCLKMLINLYQEQRKIIENHET